MTDLQTTFTTLNDKQKAAVHSVVFKQQNTLVMAGPGSGKTRIISVCAGILSTKSLNVACLSFSNDAANSISEQLEKMKIFESENLFVGTVHEFCLRFIIRPFAHLFEDELLVDFGIASTLQTKDIEKRTRPLSVEYQRSITLIRRDIVEKGIEAIRPDEINYIEAYDLEMRNQKLVDFETIMQNSIRFVEQSQLIRDYLELQFPWIVIDEYQDLGGSVHSLILQLIEMTKIKFLAVGDVNQMIYGFLGAKSSFLSDLQKEGFESIETEICHRFGNELIIATGGLLGKKLSYKSFDASIESGIYYKRVPGYQPQIKYILQELIPKLYNVADKNTPDSIAILCRYSQFTNGKFYQTLNQAFLNNNINTHQYSFSCEKNAFDALPDSPFVSWLSSCSSWRLQAEPTIVSKLPICLDYYVNLLEESGELISTNDKYELEIKFTQVLEKLNSYNLSIKDWIERFSNALNLKEVLQRAGNQSGSIVELEYIVSTDSIANKNISSFNSGATSKGIILTTMHASKGREFDYVILPVVEAGIIPNNNHDQVQADFDALRNLLYVACTRAKNFVYILSSHPLDKLPMFIKDIPNLRFEN